MHIPYIVKKKQKTKKINKKPYNNMKYISHKTKIRKNNMKLNKIRCLRKKKSENYFNLNSSSSNEEVNLHFGKPLQPTNSPYLPERLSKSLPHSGHFPTTLGS